MGNLGEASYQCAARNLKVYDTIALWCPAGTKIQSIQRFGLQKAGAVATDNVCPQSVDIYQKDRRKPDFMVLDLDDECSLDGLEAGYPDYYQKIKTQFQALCYGQEDCDLFVRNRDWPKACADKIGVRLELKTIPRTKYKEVVNRIESFEE